VSKSRNVNNVRGDFLFEGTYATTCDLGKKLLQDLLLMSKEGEVTLAWIEGQFDPVRCSSVVFI